MGVGMLREAWQDRWPISVVLGLATMVYLIGAAPARAHPAPPTVQRAVALVPHSQVIKQAVAADANGDGVPDVLVATRNRHQEEMGGNPDLSLYVFRVPPGRRATLLRRMRFDDGYFAPEEYRSAPPLNRGLMVQDVTGDGRPEVLIPGAAADMPRLIVLSLRGRTCRPKMLYCRASRPVGRPRQPDRWQPDRSPSQP